MTAVTSKKSLKLFVPPNCRDPEFKASGVVCTDVFVCSWGSCIFSIQADGSHDAFQSTVINHLHDHTLYDRRHQCVRPLLKKEQTLNEDSDEENDKELISAAETEDVASTTVGNFVCRWRGCGKRLSDMKNLQRHLFSKAHGAPRKFFCMVQSCDQHYTRRENRDRHMKLEHGAALDYVARVISYGQETKDTK